MNRTSKTIKIMILLVLALLFTAVLVSADSAIIEQFQKGTTKQALEEKEEQAKLPTELPEPIIITPQTKEEKGLPLIKLYDPKKPARHKEQGLEENRTDNALAPTKDYLLELTKGEGLEIQFKINNIFENTTLQDIALEMHGTLYGYVTYAPQELTDIRYGQSKTFTLNIQTPVYVTSGEYEIILTVTGKISKPKHSFFEGRPVIHTTTKDIRETRKIQLIINPITKVIAAHLITQAEQDIQELTKVEITSNTLNDLLADMKYNYDKRNFEIVETRYDQLAKTAEMMLKTTDLMAKTTVKIAEEKAKGLDIRETERMLELAKAAFKREEYDAAFERAEDAWLMGTVETRRTFNLFNFLKRNWTIILLILMIALPLITILTMTIYSRQRASQITRKINDLNKERQNIQLLIKHAQDACFKQKQTSLSRYHELMEQYETRLERIQKLKSRLRTKRIALLSAEQELMILKHEQANMRGLMRRVQEDYFLKETLSRPKYIIKMEELKKRMAEIEEDIERTYIKAAKQKFKGKKERRKISYIIKKTESKNKDREKLEKHGFKTKKNKNNKK